MSASKEHPARDEKEWYRGNIFLRFRLFDQAKRRERFFVTNSDSHLILKGAFKNEKDQYFGHQRDMHLCSYKSSFRYTLTRFHVQYKSDELIAPVVPVD